jgi:translation initiation factor 5
MEYMCTDENLYTATHSPTHHVEAEDMLSHLSSYIHANLDAPATAAAEFKRVCAMHGLEGGKTVRLVVGAVFDAAFLGDAARLAAVMRACVGLGDTKNQRTVINTMERLTAGEHRDYIDKFAHLLKALYENDIAEEDAIIKWYEEPKAKDVPKPDQKAIRAAATVFVDWLREAETESDED